MSSLRSAVFTALNGIVRSRCWYIAARHPGDLGLHALQRPRGALGVVRRRAAAEVGGGLAHPCRLELRRQRQRPHAGLGEEVVARLQPSEQLALAVGEGRERGTSAAASSDGAGSTTLSAGPDGVAGDGPGDGVPGAGEVVSGGDVVVAAGGAVVVVDGGAVVPGGPVVVVWAAAGATRSAIEVTATAMPGPNSRRARRRSHSRDRIAHTRPGVDRRGGQYCPRGPSTKSGPPDRGSERCRS